MIVHAGIKGKSLGLPERESQNKCLHQTRSLMCYSVSEIEWLSLTQEKILKKSPIRNQNLKSTQYKFVNKLYVITQYKKNALEKFNIKTLGCTR